MVKLKRNPETGIVEAYDEKGNKIGVVKGMGDDVKKEKNGKEKK